MTIYTLTAETYNRYADGTTKHRDKFIIKSFYRKENAIKCLYDRATKRLLLTSINGKITPISNGKIYDTFKVEDTKVAENEEYHEIVIYQIEETEVE